jgi:predicted ribosomally synthesized peptide with nif11-like leader
MSQNNISAFLDLVEKDTTLQNQLRALDLQNDAHLSQLLKIAAEAGYPITTEEWKSVGKQRAEALQAKYWATGESEISDEELSTLAGGTNGPQNTSQVRHGCVPMRM